MTSDPTTPPDDTGSSFLDAMSNLTLIDYDCPVYTNTSDLIIDNTIFWVEGVALTSVASFGILGNLLSSIVLYRHELRNSFNMLLIGLAFFDTCYIVGSVLETVRKCFKAATEVHLVLFPYLLYPGQMIALTGSVFMIVAIAFERYVSVHHPLDYNQAMNDPTEIRKRFVKYFGPVLFLSISINIPKFFETKAYAVPNRDLYGDLLDNDTSSSPPHPLLPDADGFTTVLNVTRMRVDPVYSTFVNWSQLFMLGIIPVCLLVYFNSKIYQDIRERERRRRPLAQRELAAAARATAPSNAVNGHVETPSSTSVTPNGAPLSLCSGACKMKRLLRRTGGHATPEAASGGGQGGEGEEESEGGGDRRARSMRARIQMACQKKGKRLVSTFKSPLGRVATNSPSCSSSAVQSPSSVASAVPSVLQEHDGAVMSRARRRRVEDRLAVLFMGIVVVYLLCHFPRILLNFYEMLVIEQAMACSRSGQRAFAVWAQIVTSLSHFLLVINSSINILIYSLFNTQFRNAAKALFRELCACKDAGGGGGAAGDMAAAASRNGPASNCSDSSTVTRCCSTYRSRNCHKKMLAKAADRAAAKKKQNEEQNNANGSPAVPPEQSRLLAPSDGNAQNRQSVNNSRDPKEGSSVKKNNVVVLKNGSAKVSAMSTPV